MPPEGMVHALHRASVLTAAGGRIIDLHPTPATADLSVIHADGRITRVGDLHADDAHDRHLNAETALAEAVASGLLTLEADSRFWFRRESDSIDELVDFVGGKWNGRFDDETLARARAMSSPASVLSLREEVAIARYCPLRRRSRRS
jgi:hypothetical protein